MNMRNKFLRQIAAGLSVAQKPWEEMLKGYSADHR